MHSSWFCCYYPFLAWTIQSCLLFHFSYFRTIFQLLGEIFQSCPLGQEQEQLVLLRGASCRAELVRASGLVAEAHAHAGHLRVGGQACSKDPQSWALALMVSVDACARVCACVCESQVANPQNHWELKMGDRVMCPNTFTCGETEARLFPYLQGNCGVAQGRMWQPWWHTGIL